MCVVSMVTDHYQQKWPLVPQVAPYQPPVLVPMVPITKEQWDEYQELKRKAEEYDKRTNQPDCIKPDLAAWEKAVEDVLRKKGVIS